MRIDELDGTADLGNARPSISVQSVLSLFVTANIIYSLRPGFKDSTSTLLSLSLIVSLPSVVI